MPRKPQDLGSGTQARQPTHEELALLQTALKGAKPLAGRGGGVLRDARKPLATNPALPGPGTRPAPIVSPTKTVPLPDLKAGVAAGLDAQTMRRLKRGEVRLEDGIDLHGNTLELAHAAVNRFIARAHASGKRCVLIVTGHGRGRKGSGLLRAEVPHWLNDGALRSLILGVATAQPKDGGAGALYVLLRKKRDERYPASPATR